MKDRTFEFISERSVADIAHELGHWLDLDKNMQVRVYHLDGEKYSVQAQRRSSAAAKMFGMDRAVSIRLEPVRSGRIRVVISGSRWRDKAMAASVSLVTLWPLIVTSSFGTLSQLSLIVEVRRKLMGYAR